MAGRCGLTWDGILCSMTRSFALVQVQLVVPQCGVVVGGRSSATLVCVHLIVPQCGVVVCVRGVLFLAFLVFLGLCGLFVGMIVRAVARLRSVIFRDFPEADLRSSVSEHNLISVNNIPNIVRYEWKNTSWN